MGNSRILKVDLGRVDGTMIVVVPDGERYNQAVVGNLKLATSGLKFFHPHGESHSQLNFESISDDYQAFFCPQCGLRIIFPKSVVNFTGLRLFLEKQNQKSGG